VRGRQRSRSIIGPIFKLDTARSQGFFRKSERIFVGGASVVDFSRASNQSPNSTQARSSEETETTIDDGFWPGLVTMRKQRGGCLRRTRVSFLHIGCDFFNGLLLTAKLPDTFAVDALQGTAAE